MFRILLDMKPSESRYGVTLARPEQIDSLTGLRAFAAAWVMLMHFREITPTRIWKFPVFDAAIANGAFGVDVFFVLSGFILCHVYAASFRDGLTPERARRFLAYRFARIYPVHLVTFLAMMALFVIKVALSGSGGLPDRYDAETIITTLTLTHAWIPGIQTPNMPAWSVSAEWFAYLLFPSLCFLLFRRFAAALYALVGIALAAFQPLGSYALAHVLSGFLVGTATYYVLLKVDGARLGRFAGLIVAAAIFAWANDRSPSLPIGVLLFAVWIAALSNAGDLAGRFLSLKPIVYLGEISYSLYMVHWVARIIVRTTAEKLGILETLSPALIVSTYILLTLVLSVASYHYVELPGRAVLRRLSTSTRHPAPTGLPRRELM